VVGRLGSGKAEAATESLGQIGPQAQGPVPQHPTIYLDTFTRIGVIATVAGKIGVRNDQLGTPPRIELPTHHHHDPIQRLVMKARDRARGVHADRPIPINNTSRAAT
jgi:hypothetical protein